MVLRARMSGSSEPVGVPEAKPLLFVISGPSGVGKDAVTDILKAHDPSRHYAITATTRQPRPGEQREVHYHFWTVERFEERIADGELLEWAKVYDNYYGVPKDELRDALRKNADVVLKVDVQGAATIKGLLPQAVLIFLAPHTADELMQRHYRRRTESPEELQLRAQMVATEMAAMSSFDYVVTNKQGELARAVAQVEAIISAEKCRVKPNIFTL
jgi:guanylate kinase